MPNNPPAAGDQRVTELADPETGEAGAKNTPSLLDGADQAESTDALDDRNPEEREAFRRESDVVLDDQLLIHKGEMPAYRRLFRWVTSQSVEELAARRPQEPTFQQLMQHPNKYRGKLVMLELRVSRAERDPETVANPVGVKNVYEMWCWPTSGRGWLYDVVVPELPPGFPTGSELSQHVRVYGYFFKLQAYQPANAKPNAPPLVAPLIVGKIDWAPRRTETNPAENMLSLIIAVIGGGVLVVVIGSWFVAARRKKGPVRAI